jgi:hypothetical protein
MKAMLLIFALIFIFIAPEIGLPLAVLWAGWKFRKPLLWLVQALG